MEENRTSNLLSCLPSATLRWRAVVYERRSDTAIASEGNLALRPSPTGWRMASGTRSRCPSVPPTCSSMSTVTGNPHVFLPPGGVYVLQQILKEKQGAVCLTTRRLFSKYRYLLLCCVFSLNQPFIGSFQSDVRKLHSHQGLLK